MIIEIENVEPKDRGSGIVTLPLVMSSYVPNARFTSGMSR